MVIFPNIRKKKNLQCLFSEIKKFPQLLGHFILNFPICILNIYYFESKFEKCMCVYACNLEDERFKLKA